MALSLDKSSAQAPGLLPLAKTAIQAVDRSGLNGQKAKVAVALDYSYSMERDCKSGAMQHLVEKALAVATRLDDDGAINFFVFASTASYLGEINDFAGSVDRLTDGQRMGGTNYADIFQSVREHFGLGPSAALADPPAPAALSPKGFFGFLKAQPAHTLPAPDVPAANLPADDPVYAVLLTDGARDNKFAA